MARSGQAYTENRIAKVPLSPTTIRSLLDMPSEYYVERIYVEQDPMSIVLMVSSMTIPPRPEGTYAPILEGAWEQATVIHDERPWFRWGWSPDQEPLVTLPPGHVQQALALNRAEVIVNKATPDDPLAAIYAGGVRDALMWVIGLTDKRPL